jgi:hypothetical protein
MFKREPLSSEAYNKLNFLKDKWHYNNLNEVILRLLHHYESRHVKELKSVKGLNQCPSGSCVLNGDTHIQAHQPQQQVESKPEPILEGSKPENKPLISQLTHADK